MIDRLFRNPKTTIIGLLVMVVCFLFVWFGKATLGDVGMFATGGFAMLFLKDPDDNGDKNNRGNTRIKITQAPQARKIRQTRKQK